MDCRIERSADGACVRLDGELTIYHALALRDTLNDALGELLGEPAGTTAPGPLTLDLSAVTEIDTAGLQVLMAARKTAAARGVALPVAAVSPCVEALTTLYGLDGGHGWQPASA